MSATVDSSSAPHKTGDERDLETLRTAAQHLGGKGLRDGSWFVRLVKARAKKRQAKLDAGYWDRKYPGLDRETRASKVIGSCARHAAAAGAIASIGTSTGEIIALVTEGLAAPVGVPAAVISMVLEAAYTALLQVDLMCDLASIYGVPFDADDIGEIATLFAVALELDLEEKPSHLGAHDEDDPDEPKGLMARLLDLEEGQIARRIGKKLLEEAVMSNIIPFVGVFISPRWNYVQTQKLGTAVKKYIRYRGAIRDAVSGLHLEGLDGELLVEGAWLLATVDGDASHEELLAISLLVESLPKERRCQLDHTLGDDEDEWLAKLPSVPLGARDALLEALYFLAGTDRRLQPAERRFLRRIGRVLGREIDFGRIEQICRHLARGEALPSVTSSKGPAPTA